MNLAPTADQQALADAAAAYLAKEDLRAAAETSDRSVDDDHWHQCANLGWLTVGLPEQRGGLGLGAAEEVLLFRELGRHLAPGPFLATTLALHIIAGTSATTAVELASGRRRCGFAIPSTPEGDTSSAAIVYGLDVHDGDLALVLTDERAELREVNTPTPQRCVDPSTRLAALQLGAVVATSEGAAMLERARLLIAAMAVGIGEEACSRSVAYASARVQFGRPIGSFQAVKHRCADMAVRNEAARSLLFLAATLCDGGAADAPLHTTSALLLALDAAKLNSAVNIQNHGGIGFTAELGAHRLVVRSHVLEQMAGTRAVLRDRILDAAPVRFG